MRGDEGGRAQCASVTPIAVSLMGFMMSKSKSLAHPEGGSNSSSSSNDSAEVSSVIRRPMQSERVREGWRERGRERAHLSLFPLCIPPPPPPPQSPPLSSCRLLPPSLLRGRRARRSKKLNRRPTRREDESVGRSLARSFSRLLESSVRRRLRLSLASVCPSVVVIPVPPPPPTRATDGDGRRATDDRGAPSFLEKIWAEIK